MSATNLEKLVRDHAYWADQVTDLKAQGQEASQWCDKHMAKDRFFVFPKVTGGPVNCIEEAYRELREMQQADPWEQYSYAEVFNKIEPCQNCREVRRLKAERMNARRRLGQVRSAITRIGRNLGEPK